MIIDDLKKFINLDKIMTSLDPNFDVLTKIASMEE